MLKRIFAFLIATVITASAFIYAGGVVVAESGDPFSFYDKRRSDILCGIHDASQTKPLPLPPVGENYIITFKGSKKQVADALDGLPYRPLAYSDRLVFLVTLTSADEFSEKYGDIIQSFEKDTVRVSDAVNEYNNAEAERWELDCMNALSLPYDEIGDMSKITVALLDSGINRNHPALTGANILDGYDITDFYSKVEFDLSGHGTRVAGIIAAQTGKTTASGLAQSASILPIRVSANGKDIMTSDLIDAIYMAADAGADIINMSFGGYEKISAEENAVSYAAGKGCLLIAASGNEGNKRDFAGQYSYPASYENVISVASVGQKGVICSFSQYNDMVDIAAPGEYLTLIGNNAGITYDNGTSFSAAYVTAAAIITEAYAGRRFGSAAFERLLEYSCNNTVKDSYSGYGVLDIGGLLGHCRLPIVYGASDGVTCFDRINITFDGTSATLDGEDFANGGSVFTHGNHVLEVTNGFGKRTVEFMLDTIKLDYIYRDMGSYCIFYFKRGTADVDGIPYASGAHFSLGGDHVFTLRGPNGNTAVKEFSVPTGLPHVSGVGDGEVYDNIVHITVSENGKAFLNGEPLEHEIFITENGDYTLELENSNKTEKSSISFSVNLKCSFAPRKYTTNASVFSDEDYNVVAFTAKGGRSVFVMPLSKLESDGRLILLPDKVLDVSRIGSSLCVVYTGGYVLYDIPSMFSVLPITTDSFSINTPLTDAKIMGRSIYFTDSAGVLSRLSVDTKDIVRMFDAGEKISRLIDSGRYFMLYNADNGGKLTILNKDNLSVDNTISYFPCGEPLFATSEYIFCSAGVLDLPTLSCVMQYPETDMVKIYGDIIVTNNYVLLPNGTKYGIFDGNVSGISFNINNNYILYDDGRLCIVPADISAELPAFYGAAENVDVIEEAPYEFSPFETVLSTGGKRVTDIVTCNSRLYVIYDETNALFAYDGKSLELCEITRLKYSPVGLSSNDDDVAVIFSDVDLIWTKNKGYISTNGIPTAISYGSEKIFVVSDGALYALDRGNSSFNPVLSGIYAESVAANAGILYVSSAFDVSAFDEETLSLIAFTDRILGGEMKAVDNYLLSGSYVLDAHDLSFITACNAAAYTISGSSVITARGVFDVVEEYYISHSYAGMSFAVRGNENEIFIVYGNTIRRIAYFGNPSENALPSIKDGTILHRGDEIYCKNGLMFIDGKPVDNVFSPSASGNYSLVTVMPWGITNTVGFTVRSEPEGISLRLSRSHLSPGETAHIISSLLPQEAEGSVTFSVEGDCISLAEGIVTAISIGTAKVVASIDGTDIVAYCDVTVIGDTLICTDTSYQFEPENDYLCGVASGTTVETLISKFECSTGSLRVITPNGMTRKSGLVSTGCKLVYQSSTGNTEYIDISVTGDIDGDGIVTVNDADMLYENLRSDATFEPPVFRAADINRNGQLTGADLTLLSRLVGRTPHSSVTTSAHPIMDMPTMIGGSCTFAVTVTAGKLNGTSMMATLSYDPDVLEYLSSSYYEGSVSVASSSGSLFFTALDINSLNEDRIIKVYFKVKKAGAGTTTLKLHDGEIYSNSLYAIADFEDSLILLPASDTLSVSSDNSNLIFTPSTTRYAISVLKNEVALDLGFSLPNGSQLYLPELTLDGNISEFNVRYVTSSGAQTNYIFIAAKSDSLPQADSAALLKSLSVMQYELDGEFSPHTFLYGLTVSSDCNHVRLDYDPINKGTLITVNAPDSLAYGDNIVTVYCRAENGDTATYTIIINREHPNVPEIPTPESSEDVSERPTDSIDEPVSVFTPPNISQQDPYDDSTNVIMTIMGIMIVALLAVAIVMTVRKKK